MWRFNPNVFSVSGRAVVSAGLGVSLVRRAACRKTKRAGEPDPARSHVLRGGFRLVDGGAIALILKLIKGH